MKYRKKSVVVEAFQITKEKKSGVFQAFQMTKENQVDGCSMWASTCYASYPEWIKAALNTDTTEPNALYWSALAGALVLTAKPGVCRLPVADNDWIVRDARGELQLCKPDAFDSLYEPITREVSAECVADVKAAATINWNSPASLKPGLYVWAVQKYNSARYELSTFDPVTSTIKTIAIDLDWALVYGDAVTPPNTGYWLVTEYGKAVSVQS